MSEPNATQQTAEAGFKAWVKESLSNFNQSPTKAWLTENARHFGAEMMAELRGGREDAWNALIPAFPDSMQAVREPGEPGSPTQAIVTEELTGRDVNSATDLLTASNQPTLQQDMGMERAMNGRSM